MTEGLLTTGDGCRLAYRLDGRENAPVLVLSNSLGTSMDMWEQQMPAFSERFRVLRYDSRGHGQSDVPPGSYSLDRLGRDVLELFEALRLTRVTFCGLSLGGMVGQWLGWRAPGALDRLILANTSAYMGPPDDWDARIKAVTTGGMAAIVDAVMPRWFQSGFLNENPPCIARLRAMVLATSPTGYAGCCAAIRDMDQRRLLPLIRTPTLVIAGANDPATPLVESRQLALEIPQARLSVLDAAHLSSVERPAAFAEAVLSFAEGAMA